MPNGTHLLHRDRIEEVLRCLPDGMVNTVQSFTRDFLNLSPIEINQRNIYQPYYYSTVEQRARKKKERRTEAQRPHRAAERAPRAR